MSVLKRACSLFTGNDVSQRLLEYNVKFSHYLMGIGAGTKVSTSGELGLVRMINEHPAERLCVFDVGANVGQFATLIHEQCDNSRIDLHSFEPGREAFSQLSSKFGETKKVRLNNVALGAERGIATLYSDVPASGLSSLTKRDLSHFDRSMELSQQVDVRTLDDYCDEHDIRHIHLLKIDVEGHEQDVLAGAKRMFVESRIDAVTFEFGGCNIDSRTYFRDFYQFFRNQGMQLYRITPRGFFRQMPRYREVHEQFVTTNFLARKRAA